MLFIEIVYFFAGYHSIFWAYNDDLFNSPMV